MKPWQGILLGVLFGMCVGGAVVLAASPARGQPVELQLLPTPAPISVHVAGAVVNPGVYRLPVASRVADAIQAAGGMRPEADPDLLNLASALQDGDRLWIPAKASATPAGRPENAGVVCVTVTPGPPTQDHPLNINTASVDQIDLLPGIGPVKAAAIVAYRTQNGPFTSVEELLKVPGITMSIFESLKDLVTVSPQP
jgi:competence protein ComEA